MFIEEEVSENEDTEEEKALEPRSFDEKQALAKEFAVHLSPTRLVTGLNEEGVVAIETGQTSVGNDDFE